MKKFALFLIAIHLFYGCSKRQTDQKPYVVMLSMDGFRWDYTDKTYTPNFDKIAKMGVKAEYLKPSFPTKTFPNHYTIATGLYPDHHGIVLNSFYDPETERYYSISDREAVEDGSFYGGEPFWVTAEKQGVISGSFFWVGSEAEIDGARPTYWKKYDNSITYGQRIDSVIAWLSKPEEVRPHLILWYFDEPDHSGHEFGPDSEEIIPIIARLDSLLGVFLDKLEKLPISDQINFIVTSDHGMASVSDDRRVIFDELINMEWIEEIQGYNPNFNMKAKEGYVDSLFAQLSGIEHIKVWEAGTLPERLHYGMNPRTLDLVVMADSSWSVVISEDKSVGNGAHGYDNANPDMRTIFYGFGPVFKKNFISSHFDNVDIYPLICNILQLEPAINDGNFENVKNLLLTED
ncbi:MAG: alkaline phosphatase family protein [Bacteroidales bacterium]|nr:alkaline phosphatase family protein [Bacteroidales bacterium]